MTNKMNMGALQSILWAGFPLEFAEYSVIKRGFKYEPVPGRKDPLSPIPNPSWCVFHN